MKFDPKFFAKMHFTAEQIGKYFKSAEHNLRIAESVAIPEVIFKFSYDALIKFAVTVVAHSGFKVKNTLGHHVKMIETLSLILKDENIEILGNVMRNKRNLDLYGEGAIVTEKESDEYLKFVQNIYAKVNVYLYK